MVQWLACEASNLLIRVRVPLSALYSPVAQLGERLSYKQDVAGSIPARTTNFASIAQWIRAPLF